MWLPWRWWSHPDGAAGKALLIQRVVLGEQVEEVEDTLLHGEPLVLLEGRQNHASQRLALDRVEQTALEELLQTYVSPGEVSE